MVGLKIFEYLQKKNISVVFFLNDELAMPFHLHLPISFTSVSKVFTEKFIFGFIRSTERLEVRGKKVRRGSVD